MNNHPQRGFTLVEMLVVLIIAAILAIIALPSYRSYMLKTNRAEARAALADILTAQENFRAYCGIYANMLDANQENCQQGKLKYSATGVTAFALSITAADVLKFTVKADAMGVQAQDAACRTMKVSVNGAEVQFSPQECWK